MDVQRLIDMSGINILIYSDLTQPCVEFEKLASLALAYLQMAIKRVRHEREGKSMPET